AVLARLSPPLDLNDGVLLDRFKQTRNADLVGPQSPGPPFQQPVTRRRRHANMSHKWRPRYAKSPIISVPALRRRAVRSARDGSGENQHRRERTARRRKAGTLMMGDFAYR